QGHPKGARRPLPGNTRGKGRGSDDGLDEKKVTGTPGRVNTQGEKGGREEDKEELRLAGLNRLHPAKLALSGPEWAKMPGRSLRVPAGNVTASVTGPRRSGGS